MAAPLNSAEQSEVSNSKSIGADADIIGEKDPLNTKPDKIDISSMAEEVATGNSISEMEEVNPSDASTSQTEPKQTDSQSENKLQTSDGLSAFHVVSYPDGHKEVTSDILNASEKKNSSENTGKPLSGLASSGDEKQTDCTEVKHFSAQVLQQEGQERKDEKGTDDKVSSDAALGREEDEILGTNQKGNEMDGVNFEDIDEAVERALLSEEEGVSCEKSVPDATGGDMEQESGLESCQPTTQNSEADVMEEQSHVREKVYNIDEETRMGLDQTPVHDQASMAESFTYPSLPPRKLFQLEDTKDSEQSDPDTKISTSMTDTEDIRLRNTIGVDESTNVSVASDSNTDAPTPSSSTRKVWRGNREGIGIPQDGEGGQRVFTAENLFEYQWPQDGGDWHLLQEQVSEYLDVKSFKRKYPDLDRRVCDKEEKDFLRDKGVVTETQSDLGLTALRSEEVYDLMMKDYNEKYQEYITILQEKQRKVIREKHKEYSEQAKIDKSKMESYVKKAARSAAEFNANMMREKKDERRAYFDLQTYTIHFPKSKFGRLKPSLTKVGVYPVAVLAGQYQDNYKRYSPEELKHFPVKTVMLDPRKPVKYVRPMPESVRLAILEKQKPPPPPVEEEKMDTTEAGAGDTGVENKENTGAVDGSCVVGLSGESLGAATLATEGGGMDLPLTPLMKFERKYGSKSTGKKRSKIELSPERPKKMFKKYRESMPGSLSEGAQEEGMIEGTPDPKSLIPKIHGLEKCRICKQRSTKEERKTEKMVKCAQCCRVGHTNCLDLTDELVAVIQTYPWQCMECKTCVKCLDPFDEDQMMFCDRCDRGYHTFCIGLDDLPTGHWECGNCETGPVVTPKPKLQDRVKVAPSQQTSDSSLGSPVTLQAKKEMVEEGQDSATTNIQGTESTVSLPVGENKPGSTETGVSLLVGTNVESTSATVPLPLGATPSPLEPVKKKRGRKPKNPNAPPPPPKPAALTGERQSRRLKIKEEEEEEKKRQEEERLAIEKKKLEKELKLKKKMRKLKRLEEAKAALEVDEAKRQEWRKMASEAALAVAKAAAESYGMSVDTDQGKGGGEKEGEKMDIDEKEQENKNEAEKDEGSEVKLKGTDVASSGDVERMDVKKDEGVEAVGVGKDSGETSSKKNNDSTYTEKQDSCVSKKEQDRAKDEAEKSGDKNQTEGNVHSSDVQSGSSADSKTPDTENNDSSKPQTESQSVDSTTQKSDREAEVSNKKESDGADSSKKSEEVIGSSGANQDKVDSSRKDAVQDPVQENIKEGADSFTVSGTSHKVDLNKEMEQTGVSKLGEKQHPTPSVSEAKGNTSEQQTSNFANSQSQEDPATTASGQDTPTTQPSQVSPQNQAAKSETSSSAKTSTSDKAPESSALPQKDTPMEHSQTVSAAKPSESSSQSTVLAISGNQPVSTQLDHTEPATVTSTPEPVVTKSSSSSSQESHQPAPASLTTINTPAAPSSEATPTIDAPTVSPAGDTVVPEGTTDTATPTVPTTTV